MSDIVDLALESDPIPFLHSYNERGSSMIDKSLLNDGASRRRGFLNN